MACRSVLAMRDDDGGAVLKDVLMDEFWILS
jgi:hypothetical protein